MKPERTFKSKLELASFRVLHATADTSRHEKVDCCAVFYFFFQERCQEEKEAARPHNYRPACSRPCSRGPYCAVVQSCGRLL